MKSKRSIISIALAAAIIALTVFLIVFFTDKSYNWTENYSPDDDLPYGASIFKSLIESDAGAGFVNIEDSLALRLNPDSVAPGSNYILIGREVYLDSSEISTLVKFVEKGNNAFIISHSFSNALLDSLLEVDVDEQNFNRRILESVEDTSVVFNLYASGELMPGGLECTYLRDNIPLVRNWTFFRWPLTTRQMADVDVLGYLNGYHPNYIRFRYGSGSFYLHSSPLAFSNYNLLREETFDYVNKTMAWRNEGVTYWDDYNRFFQWEAAATGSTGGGSYQHDDGPLAFILAERSLRWAWFVLLATGFLYLAFATRRKQRPVPVIHQPANTSVEFAETIGSLFRMEKNHHKLTRLKMRLFLAHILERYHVRLLDEGDQEHEAAMKTLAERSNIPLTELEELLRTFVKVTGEDDPRGRGLIEFDRQLRRFYDQAR